MPIDSHLTYLQKHAFCLPQILDLPASGLGIVVVIPVFDELGLVHTLESLYACEPSSCAVEVIVVVSGSETDGPLVKARNQQCFNLANAWAQDHSRDGLHFHLLHFLDLPAKHAGVGLTRKIGMDEAVHRFALADNPQGIIVSLDADARVDVQYFRAIEQYFATHKQMQSCTLGFSYPIDDELNPYGADAILRIELAERILVAGLRHAGHPYAHHALGTAMAVRVGAYQAQAGMNRRKAGEDFDFLQKFIELGVHGECLAAQVKLSGRISRRKPGGIGQRVAAYCEEPDPSYPVYALAGFQELAAVLPRVQSWYDLDAVGLEAMLTQFPMAFSGFMQENAFVQTILEIQKYTSHAVAFEKRFYRWFNSLKTFQFLAHGRDRHFPNQPILEMGNAVRKWVLGDEMAGKLELVPLLDWFRMQAVNRSAGM